MQVGSEGGRERLAFSCFLLGDPALVQDYGSYELDVEGALAGDAADGLTDSSKRLGQEVFDGFAAGQAFFELGRFALEFVILDLG